MGALGAGLVEVRGVSAGDDAGAAVAALRASTPQVEFPPAPARTVCEVIGGTAFRAPEGGTEYLDDYSAAKTGTPGPVVASFAIPPGGRLRRVDLMSVMSPGVAAQTFLLRRLDMASNTISVVGSATIPAPSGLSFLTTDIPADVVANDRTLFLLRVSSTRNGLPLSAVALMRVHYVPPARSFVPLAPVRVFDSRWDGSGGRFTGGTSRVVSVADARTSTGAIAQANAVPAGAVAITFNLTVSGTQGGAGLLSVTPASSTSFTTSTINWNGSGVSLANGSTVSLSGNRQVRIHCAGSTSTNAILDVTGFYI